MVASVSSPQIGAIAKRKPGRRAAFLSVSCLTILVVTYCLQTTVLDSAGFVKTLTPVASRPELQQLVATQLRTTMENSLLSTPIGRIPGKVAALQPRIEAAAIAATSSSQFPAQWLALESSVHDQIINRIANGQANGPLTITENLAPLAASVLHQLSATGVQHLPTQLPASTSDVAGPTITAAQLSSMHAVYMAIIYLEAGSAFLALLTFIVAMVLSKAPLQELGGIGRRSAVQLAVLCAVLAALAVEVRSKLGTPDDVGALSVALFNSLDQQVVHILQITGGIAAGLAIATMGLEGILLLASRVGQSSRPPITIKQIGRVLQSSILIAYAAIVLVAGTPDLSTSIQLIVVTVCGLLFVYYSGRILETLGHRRHEMTMPALATPELAFSGVEVPPA